MLALMGVCLLGSSCAPRGRARGPVVERLSLVGNEAVEDGAIRESIATRETSWVPFSPRRRFDPNVWATDQQRVERLYQSRGFYQVRVEDAVDEVAEERVRLSLVISEGPPTRVTEARVLGLDALPDSHRQRVLEQVTLQEGDVFLEAAWERMDDDIVAALRALGYAEARVRPLAAVDLGTQEARLELRVEPGARYRFGEVRVEQQGPATVEPWRIEEQVRRELEREPWFSPEALEEARSRVFGLDVFGAVRVRQGEGEPETGTIPIIVEVNEAPPRELTFGLGLGVDQFRQGAQVSAGFSHHNFRGGMRLLRVSAVAGWAFIPNFYTRLGSAALVARSGPVARLTGEFWQPRVLNPDLSLRTRVELERDIQPGFSLLGGRGRAGLVWRPRSWLTLETSYNLEAYSLDAGPLTLTDVPALVFGCVGGCALSYLEQFIAVDRRDDPHEPREGYYLGLSLQEGGGPLGGTFDYLRLVPEVRGYTSFLPGRRLTLAARLRLGTLLPLARDIGDSPIVVRFFSGGDTMRGFGVRRLSPIRLVSRPREDGEVLVEPIPVGGNGLFESSLEVRYSLTESLVLASFLDAGFVTPGPLELSPAFISRNLFLGVGAGVRYRTPVGPVRLDFAVRPDIGPPLPFFGAPDGATLPAGGCFGFGGGAVGRAGSPEGWCIIHISVGEAF
jgi:translocation and assembly module TamA